MHIDWVLYVKTEDYYGRTNGGKKPSITRAALVLKRQGWLDKEGLLGVGKKKKNKGKVETLTRN